MTLFFGESVLEIQLWDNVNSYGKNNSATTLLCNITREQFLHGNNFVTTLYFAEIYVEI